MVCMSARRPERRRIFAFTAKATGGSRRFEAHLRAEYAAVVTEPLPYRFRELLGAMREVETSLKR
ncbi:NepR family anti-sigma factor [Hyphomonas sp. KY3]|uniref:NepR family anti-sigma factor n=1 Tax=Hyphomonas sp. KY3 TaxID=2016196 RepID=UPI00353022A1